MKYRVIKKFRDRLSKSKLFAVGDYHEPKDEKRAKQLITLGYIEPVPVKKKKKDDDK